MKQDLSDIEYQQVVSIIDRCLGKCQDVDNGRHLEGGEIFQAKYIPKKYLKYFKEIVSLSKKYKISDLYNNFYDKNVLVIDDVISSGITVSQEVESIKNNFNPKKVDVLTLLSSIEN